MESIRQNVFDCTMTILCSTIFFCGEIFLGKIQLDYSKIYYSCDPTCSNVCPKLQDYLHTFGMINLIAGSISLLSGLCSGLINISSLTNNQKHNYLGTLCCGYLTQLAHIYTFTVSYDIEYHFLHNDGQCHYCLNCYPEIYAKFFNIAYLFIGFPFVILLCGASSIVAFIVSECIGHFQNRQSNDRYQELNNIEINYK